MKFLTFVFLLCFAVTGHARGFSSPGKGSKFSVGGYYGLGFINPSDINISLGSQATTPRLNNLTQATILGGYVGYSFVPKFQMGLSYDQQLSSNSKRTTTPSVNNAGYEVEHTVLWLNANYFLVNSKAAYIYLGVGGGYPLTSKVTTVLGSRTEYDADKTTNYKAQLGFGYKLFNAMSIFIETSYQSVLSGDVKRGSTALTLSGNRRVKLDLTGARAIGGISFHF